MKRRPVSLHLDISLLERLRVFQEENSRSRCVENLIRDYVEEKENLHGYDDRIGRASTGR